MKAIEEINHMVKSSMDKKAQTSAPSQYSEQDEETRARYYDVLKKEYGTSSYITAQDARSRWARHYMQIHEAAMARARDEKARKEQMNAAAKAEEVKRARQAVAAKRARESAALPEGVKRYLSSRPPISVGASDATQTTRTASSQSAGLAAPRKDEYARLVDQASDLTGTTFYHDGKATAAPSRSPYELRW